MRNPDDDDERDWSPRDRNLELTLWWALGIVFVIFATLAIVLS